MSVTTTLPGSIRGVIGGPEDTIEGTNNGEWILGTDGDDVIDALGGNDFVQAFAGNDEINAGEGNDTVLGGEGDDTIDGGAGNDVLRGDAGADTFLFDPSQAGNDSIVDLTSADGDVIAFSAAGLAGLGLDEFSGAALDASDQFDLVEDQDTGDLVIEHPGGTITLNGVPFAEEGQDPPTFAGLEQAGLLQFTALTQGTDEGEELTGTDGDDVIQAMGGDDTITPLGGDDTISTGSGRDTINIDPSNPDEGDDVITDFTAPSSLDATVGDSINFALQDLQAADPDLPAADGDASSLSLADFDASQNWTLGASGEGNLLLTHPGGSIEFTNAAFSDQTFADLGTVIQVDGQALDQPIPVDGADDGATDDGVADGDDGAADGGDGVADGDDGTVDDGVADGDDGTADDDVAGGDEGTAGGDDTGGGAVAAGDDGTAGDDTGDDGEALDDEDEEVLAETGSPEMDEAIA